MENQMVVQNVFRFKDAHIRVVMRDGDPWFVAKDVCEILGIVNSRNVLSRIPENQKGVAPIDTPGGMQNLSIISEAGLYRLVMRSDKREAEPFIDWVTSEVLPQIRKTGKYLPLPSNYIEALKALVASEEQKQQLQIKLDESMEWFSIKRMEKLNPGKKFKWQVLKYESRKLDIPVKKTFDQNYGEVNVYHKDVWESLYFDTLEFE